MSHDQPRFAVIHSGADPKPETASLFQQVCRIIDQNDTEAQIFCNGNEFRLPLENLKPVVGVNFESGAAVRCEKGTANVEKVSWHFQRNEPIYLLSLDGKPLKKRYFNPDLEAI
jgi:hypothetical protein